MIPSDNQISIGPYAQNNIVIAGDHNTVVQYIAKQLTRYPYKFLSSYDLADRDIFFGRTAVIEELVGKIPRHKVLLINGASGAGKSSLLNAGVIPRWTEQGHRFLTIRDYTDPLQQLRTEFLRQQWLTEVETESLTQMLRALHQQSVTLLIFDQFEQFFLHVPYATRQAFLQEFKACLSSLSVVEMKVIFAIRRDFLGQMLAEFEQVMPTMFAQETQRLDLYPLSREEARSAIINPLKNLTVKIGYDKAFVEDILLTGLLEQTSDQVGIEPPHLQIVCNQLYETAHRRLSAEVDMVQINAALYEELGGVEQILRTYLDDVVKEITADKPAKIAVIRSLLKAMIETSGTRRFVSVADVQRALPDVDRADIERFLGQLQDRRVLETRQREEMRQFSLSHEIMVAQVASWFDEREWERKRAEETLERGLNEWQSSGTLLSEKQLSYIQDIRENLPPQLDNKEARELLAKSEASWKRQRFLKRAGIASLVATTLGLASYTYWYRYSYEWEHVTYCNTYAKRYGIMQCVGELTKEQVQGRAVSYKFIRNGRKNSVWKVQTVRGTGKTIELTRRHTLGTYFEQVKEWQLSPSQREFVLDQNQKIVYEKAFSDMGELIWGLVYSPLLEGQPAHAHYVGVDGYPLRSKEQAEFVEFTYTIKGDEQTIRYFDRQHQPKLGLGDVFVIQRLFNERGLIIMESYFDANDQPMLSKDGLHGVTMYYDDQANMLEKSYFDTELQPMLNEDGFHKWVARYDERNNEIEREFFGTQGQPILNNSNFHKWIGHYNERGDGIEVTYFDIQGQPTLTNDGYQKWTARYDEHGNEIEKAYFNVQGQPILLKGGYHKVISGYDERGNIIELSFFNEQGNPTIWVEGWHKGISRHNEEGKIVEEAYFGIQGQPIMISRNFSFFKSTFYHKLVMKRDNHGQLTGVKDFFDTFGNLIERRDTNNKLLEKAYFDAEGRPIYEDEIHRWIYRYDEQGERIETIIFDIFGNLTQKRDGKDKLLQQSYFDTNGQPTLDKGGVHKWTAKYDVQGNRIEETFFDTKGQPVLDKKFGYHKEVMRYDERGNKIESAFFDTQGTPTFLKELGIHKLTEKYDEKGNVIGKQFFDVNGQPIQTKVTVSSILPGSQGEKLGIQAGDIFTHYDGKPLTDTTNFVARRTAEPADGPAKELKVLREGKELTFMVKPGKIGAELQD